MKKIFGFLAVLAIALTASVPASADWHGGHGWHGGGHSHFFFGFNFPLFYDPYPYYPAYYPAYYYAPPPPVYYYPPPAYYAPPRVASGPSQCRQFSGDATNDQTGEPFVGTACLWPDGRWHISGGY